MNKISGHNIIKFIFVLSLYQFIAMISGIITKNSMESWYYNIEKSTLNPPSYLFPIVWTLLYTMLAFVAVYLWNNKKSIKPALVTYLAQMFFNWSWTPIFFYFHLTLYAAIILVIMLILNFSLIYQMWNKNKIISYMMMPYLAWLIFATYLNISIVILNW